MIERKRPVKQFRVLQAFGPYVKGQLIQPTGGYRQVLVCRGLIEEVPEVVETESLMDRMVPKVMNREVLTLKKRRVA